MVGSPVSGRHQRDLADVAGCFVNVVPLRLRWAADATTAGLFAAVRDAVADGLADQQVPADMVVAAVGNGRSTSGTSLFDLLFSIEEHPSIADMLAGLRAERIPLKTVATKADLHCAAERDAGGLVLRWEYRTDAVDGAKVRALAETFPQVLRDLLAEPGLRSARADRDDPRAVSPPGAGQIEPDGTAPRGGAPDGPLEASVAQVWAEVLGQDAERIGRLDDFFSIGGHSLLAARAAARLTTRLGVQVDLRDVLEHPTVAALAAAAGQAGRRRAAPIPRLPASVTAGPLSFPQRQVYLHSLLAPDSAVYNIPLVAVVQGDLDAGAMHAALRYVAGRHEALRTGFAIRDGEAVQRVLSGEAADPGWSGRDLRGWEQRDVLAVAREEVFRPFDVSGGGPLVRMFVLRTGEREHVIGLTLHHLVADGRAAGIVLDELCAAYTAFTSGAWPDLPPVALRYLEYAAWQRDPDVDYWITALADAPGEIDLPGRPGAGITPRGASVPVEAGTATTMAVRALAARTGCTPFMILATAFAITLAAYSGQRDLLIGTPTANRSHPDTDLLVGLLANPVALRARLDGNPTVAQALERMRAVCVDAFARQDTPLEQVVAAIGPERSHDRSPLFQVMIAFDETLVGSLRLPGLQITPTYLNDPPAKYELLLNLHDDGERIVGACEYAADRYEAPLVESLVRYFGRVLTMLPAHLHRQLSELPLCPAQERAALIPAASGAAARYDPHVPLHHLVERSVDRAPDAVAVIGADGASLSYRELDDAANAAAGLLGCLRPGEPVGVCAVRSAELVVAEYAVLKAGGAILPLDPAWPAARLEAVLRDAGCRTVLTGPAPDEATSRGPLPSGITAVPVRAAGTAPRPRVPVRRGDLAAVIYTSGSTGRPKGVQVEHAAIANNLLWMQQDWPLDAADRLLVKTAATFDVAVKEIFWPLIAGATLVLAPPGAERDPDALLRLLESRRITICHLVPSMLALCLETAELTGRPFGPALRYLMCGAEELAPATRDSFAAACPADMLHMYGPTETTVAVTGWACRAGDRIDGRVPLGRAMPNCRLYVLDADLNPAPPLAWGELHVSGLPLARGYLERRAETAASFIPDPFSDVPGARMYRTGDVVRLRDDGLLEFRGRADGQVKIRGFRVEVGEVEAALRAHPAVSQAAVCSAADAVLVAYVVLAGSAVTGQDLRGHVGALLPDYMVPSRVVPVAELPRTESGKVDRAALRARPLPRPEDQAFREPADDVERAVAAIWSQVLGTAPIGADDDFFVLGGQSLQAARIVNLLGERFGRDLPLRDLFTEPTVAGLARLLRAPAPAAAVAPIPRLAR